MEIDDELAVYLRPGPYSVIVATCDAERAPDVVRGWAPRVVNGCAAIDVFVGRLPATQLVENVRDNGAMAFAVCNVLTFQALQLKGKCIEVGEPAEGDAEQVRDHIEGFVAGAIQLGFPEEVLRAVGTCDVIRLRFVPEQLFDQTPGPDAGKQR